MLVCLAVWLATAARDAGGKIVGIYLPIMSFTSIGLEHSIANMWGPAAGSCCLHLAGASTQRSTPS